MRHRRRARLGNLALLCILALALYTAAPLDVAVASQQSHAPERLGALQASFAAAASEFGVPEGLLLAIAYNLSRWEQRGGAPSFAGGYGPMQLTHLDELHPQDGKADDIAQGRRDSRGVARLHTLDAAAALIGVSTRVIQRDPAQNIRAGAALLATYARETTGALPPAAADWYGAVMRYSQSSDLRAAAHFADGVYTTLQQGATRTTADGQTVVLTAEHVVPNKPAAVTMLPALATPTPECPADLTNPCTFVPAAYAQNDPNNPANYGNYDLAERGSRPPTVRYIVIHDIEGTAESAITVFRDPTYGASAHYVVDTDGAITQMVETKNVGWHAGNWYINGQSIGIELAGYAIEGAYTAEMYMETAKLVRYLADLYQIPLDRAHIIGHDDIPGPTSSYQAGMHWDPGPFWDWTQFMNQVRNITTPPSGDATSAIVTLRISPSSNTQTVKDCEGDGHAITRGTSFVYLRTAPSPTAPYISNPYITSDPECANNWATKAASGQTFYRFDTSTADWDGIYFGGQKAYFYNPGHSTFTVSGAGPLVKLVKPAGRRAVSVYGRAYPERAAYPRRVSVQQVSALSNYSIPLGQSYVAVGPFNSDYFYAPQYTLDVTANQDIVGQTQYYQVFFNHRFVFLKSSDVAVVP
jgi:N-acetyl-anhydromuramyl-L-alanine amidase AmpD